MNFRYCECFQGGVVCSEKCRCLECRNFTGSTFRLDAIHRMQLKERSGDDTRPFESLYDTERNIQINEENSSKENHLPKPSSLGSSLLYRNNTLIWVNILSSFLLFLFLYFFISFKNQ